MDEKKPVKISLSTFLLVLALMVIIIMAYFIYKLNNGKSIETEKVANLNNEISYLQDTINSLNEKINSISTIVNSSNSNNSTLNSSNEETYVEILNELDKDEYLYVTDIDKNNDTCTFKGIIYKKYTIDSSKLKKIVSDKKIKINGETYKVDVENGNETEGYSLLDKNNEASGYNIFKENRTYYLTGGDSYLYKSTGLKKKITIEQSTRYSNMENDDPNSPKTIKEAFSMELYSNVMKSSIPKEELIGNGPLYKFEFENGKCAKVLNIAYWN